ncbi:MAG: 5'-Nucleotidase domain protein [Ignavibacteriae bacterium]|nr:MAG: 5'-Nucleotidase domain protein [Ignavibacteriota bacterium]
MKKLQILGLVLLFLVTNVLVLAQSPGNFSTSLHATRAGKAYWYKTENGGFESLTNIPMSNLKCTKCHPGTYADGSTVDPATYTPNCNDCHNFAQGSSVAENQCLKCHSRQKAEINLYSDVHRSKGMVCTSCHTKKEMHGDGNSYNSMFEVGAMERKCEDCHTTQPNTLSHTVHGDNLECKACHSKTVISCFNCHFESEVNGNIKRPYSQFRDFIILARRQSNNKITTATMMGLTYNGQSFFAMGPYNAHTIDSVGRQCSDCHNNSVIQEYNQTGKITITKWDAGQNKLLNTKAVIPVPSDWKQSFAMDFVDYTGPVDSATNPALWIFLKSGFDGAHMLYLDTLTSSDMAKLSISVGVKDENAIPKDFNLKQNYPNPFNPTTSIEFQLPKTTSVTLKVYNLLGKEVQTLINNRIYSAGTHSIVFNGRNLPSGVYVYRLEADGKSFTKKMILTK